MRQYIFRGYIDADELIEYANNTKDKTIDANDIARFPTVQPTIFGYNIEHLELIARVLQKENLPPERVTEILTDIGRIVAIIGDEFEETLRKAVYHCSDDPAVYAWNRRADNEQIH